MSTTNSQRPGGQDDGRERRESPRIPVEMWVEESTERELYFQRGANLSSGGIYLENTIPHTLPGDALPVKVKGEIVNAAATDELGMGIKFIEMTPEVEQRIAEFVQRAGSSTR